MTKALSYVGLTRTCDRAQTANNDGETTLIPMRCLMIDVWLIDLWNVSSCDRGLFLEVGGGGMITV